MPRIQHLVPAVLASLFLGSSMQADPAPTLLCGSHIPSLQVILDQGTPDDVDFIVASLLDDPNASAYLGTLSAKDANAWFAVIFHPAFLDRLADDGAARQASWDALADIIEAAYMTDQPKPGQVG